MTAVTEPPVTTGAAVDARVRAPARPRPGAPVTVFAVCAVVCVVHALDALVEEPEGRSPAVEAALGALVLLLAAGAFLGFRRGGRPARGALALLAGTAATVEGAGVTVAHAVRDAPSGADITGIASLAAGLTLLGLGTVLAVGCLRRWWRLLAIPAAVVAVSYVLEPLTVAVVVTHPAAKSVGSRTPAASGLAYREVSVTTADGAVLSGWYVPSRNGAAVVAVPGAWSTRSDVLDQVVVLARHGYGVLDLDPRGHGRSTGSAMDFGWFGEADVEAAVGFLVRQEDVDASRIGALGLSMGGEEVLTAASADPRIRAVVSEGGTNRTAEDVEPVAAWTEWPMYRVLLTAADLLSPAAPPIPLVDAVARIAPRPVLLIAAGEEPELTLSRALRDAAPATTRLWEPADTGHTQALARHPQEWSAQVLGFLDGALLG